MRTTFLVGRVTPRSSEMVVREGHRAPAPIPGPWTLRALVRLPAPRTPSWPENTTVH